jgi:hypothetical protein
LNLTGGRDSSDAGYVVSNPYFATAASAAQWRAALIGQLGHVGLGAALFHARWLAMAGAAWRDDGVTGRRASR